MRLERGCGLFVSMGGEVVENDHRSGGNLGDQNLPDIGGKRGPIHRTLDDPWCNQGITSQPGDQGLRPPTAEGRVHGQSFSLRRPASQPGQVRLHRRFVQENNAVRHASDGRRAMRNPVVALPSHLRAPALGGHQRLFLYVKPRRFSRAAMAE